MKAAMKPILAAAGVVAHDVDSAMKLITPATAQRWLANSMWGKQRPYRDFHAEKLAEAMRRGEFVEGTMIQFAKLNDDIYNINGQHTLNAIVKANMAIRLTVLTTVVSSESEIAHLYANTDQGLKRSLSDAYQAHDLSNKFDLSKSQVNQIGAGIKQIIGGFSGNHGSKSYELASPAERVRGFDTYGAAGKEYLTTITGCPISASRALRVASVVAVALVTFEQSPVKAREFWSQVAFSDALDTTDPRKTLINYLMANDSKKLRDAARSRAVAHAWNVFLAGGKLSRIKNPDWTQPINIAKV